MAQSGSGKTTGVVLVAVALGALWAYDTGRFQKVWADLAGNPNAKGPSTGYPVAPGTIGTTGFWDPTGAVVSDTVAASQGSYYNSLETAQYQQEQQLLAVAQQNNQLALEQQNAGAYGGGIPGGSSGGASAYTQQSLLQCHGVGDCIAKGVVFGFSEFGSAIGSLFGL